MQNNTLQMKRAMRTALLVLLLSAVKMGKGYAQVSTWYGGSSTWTHGDGSQEAPFLIENANNLAFLSKKCSEGEHYYGVYFKLTIDINLNNKEWIPIGLYNPVLGMPNNDFQGHFDGDGHFIDNISIRTTSTAGLFGITRYADLRNIGVGGVIDVELENNICFCGGIVADATETTITNCYNTCSIRGKCNYGHQDYCSYCGGIVGRITNSCVIKDCNNLGAIESICKRCYNKACSGGIVGYIRTTQNSSYSIQIDNSYNTGVICSYSFDASSGNTRSVTLCSAGVIALIEGDNTEVSLINCRNEGAIEREGITDNYTSGSKSYYYGGIVGKSSISMTIISNCYNVGDIRYRHNLSGGYYSPKSYCYFGGLIGTGSAIMSNCYNEGEINVSRCYTCKIGGIIGDGTESIVNDCYNNGDLSISCYSDVGYDPHSGTIGGLFGAGGSKIMNCQNTGNIWGSYCNNIGGICGYSLGEITNCDNMGTVGGTSINSGGIAGIANGNIRNCINTSVIRGSYYCGGIVGSGDDDCNICYCCNTGNITASGNNENANNGSYCGGIIGVNRGIITVSCNTGDVESINSKKNTYVGGISGYSTATISTCYNMGLLKSSSTNGSSYSAGIVGFPDEYSIVKNSYNAGIILSGNNKGGIRGFTNGIVTNCYYLDACNGEIMGGTPKTESEMKSVSFPDLLNADSIVFVYDANHINQGYPIFGDGSENTHSISINPNITGGAISVSASEAIAGESITIFVSPNSGYELQSLTVYNANDASQTVSVTNNTFVMPAFDVMIFAIFGSGAYYSISISQIITGGSVSSSTSSAMAGETVTLNVRPNSGYELQTLTVYNANDASQTVAVTNNTFIMPSFNVMVSASFNYTSVDENGLLDVSIYPNPTSSIITIEAEGLKHIHICNMLGQVIYEREAFDNEFEYDFSKQGEGVYLIRIETTSGVVTKRVVVAQ